MVCYKKNYFAPIFILFLISHKQINEGITIIVVNTKKVPQSPFNQSTRAPEEEAKVSIFDSALMFGDMVFEMTRSFNKKQFKLKEHLERLYLGIKIYRIPFDLSLEQMEDICYETIEINEKVFESHDEHRLMINISRGPLSIYSSVFDD